MRPASVRVSSGARRPVRRTGGRDRRDEDGPRDRDPRDALQLRDRTAWDHVQARSARHLVAHANATDDLGPAEGAVSLEAAMTKAGEDPGRQVPPGQQATWHAKSRRTASG